MRRKVSAANWRFPRRFSFTQWRRLHYRARYWYVTEAQCNLMGFWRDCARRSCRRARRCGAPQPCYWERKRKLTAEQQQDMDKRCAALRDLLKIGFSRNGSEGLLPF